MKTMLCPLLIATALAGCGSSLASLSSPVPAFAGPTLSGTLGDAIQGNSVGFHPVPQGEPSAVGQNGRGAASHPRRGHGGRMGPKSRPDQALASTNPKVRMQ